MQFLVNKPQFNMDLRDYIGKAFHISVKKKGAVEFNTYYQSHGLLTNVEPFQVTFIRWLNEDENLIKITTEQLVSGDVIITPLVPDKAEG